MYVRGQRNCVLKCIQKKHMHAFPKDETSRNVWLKQLGIEHASATSYVCDRHFSQKMRPEGVGVKLTPWAIPDMNLQREEVIGPQNECSQVENNTRVESSAIHLNGYSNSDPKPDSCFVIGDSLDFDVLLAKVHKIEDLSSDKNKNKAELVGENEFGLILDNTCDMDTSEGYSSIVLNSFNEEIQTNDDIVSASPVPVEINSKFKRKLIASVRRRRILYDPEHPSFSNIEMKNRTWERIGKFQKLDGKSCRELWLNMRYDYQNHVRSLRKWLAGEGKKRERPRISFENDLLFLWRFIADKSYCESSDEEVQQMECLAVSSNDFQSVFNLSNKDDPVIAGNIKNVPVVDHAYAHNMIDETDPFVCNLIEAVRFYSELYDSAHPHYGDAKRKSIIWEAISNELNTKAPDCMYMWIKLQLRYEFEIVNHQPSYLSNKMEFLKKFILTNEKSPFKRTTLSSNKWYEPLTSRNEQHSLLQHLSATKKYRSFFMCIDSQPDAHNEYQIPCWVTIGKMLKRRPEKCEVTWIIMQTMYAELIELRRNNCPLSGWEFESVITNLRAIVSSQMLKSKESTTVRADSVSVPCDDIVQSEIPQEWLKEITFKIPGQPTKENPSPEPQIVRFTLDTPVKDLPEKSIVEIDSVLENAHIVVLTRYKKGPDVFLFTLKMRKQLIAEVMARPLVFNEPCKHSRLARIFWGEISIEMKYPAEICMYFWDYIMKKLMFMDYDPSFKISKGPKWIPPPNPIFVKFQKYAESKDWVDYVSVLPDFIQEISNFPLIYIDLKINSSWNRRQCHARDMSEIWSIITRKFALLENPKLIWEKLKQLFLLYMSEIELNIYNSWPKFWFRVLEKLTFLFKLRYGPKDPIYYVIKNKIEDEINEGEPYGKESPAKLDPITNARVIFGLLNEKEYLDDFTWVNRARFIAKMKSFPMLYNINHPLFGNKEAKLDAWQEMALSFHCTVGECHLIFQHLMKGFLLFRARDINQMCRVNTKYWEHMTYIYSCAMPNAIDPKLIEDRTFRPSSNGSTIKLAEEYQAEISLVDAKPRLILKNFAAAVNSLPIHINPSTVQQVKCIFSQYEQVQNDEVVVDV